MEIGAVKVGVAQRGWSAIFLVTLTLLAGCDTMPYVRIVNDTGAPVTLLLNAESRDETTMQIQVGGSSKNVIAYGTGRQFKIVQNGCERGYVFPEMGVNYPFEVYKGGYPVMTQASADKLVYLLPDDAKGPLPLDRLASGQKHGFPLHPVFDRCVPPSDRGGHQRR